MFVGSALLADASQGDQDSAVSIRISQGGRLFGIMAALGGAATIGSAGLPWTMLGLFVIAGAACFITLGSRRMRMTAGALVVLAAAAGVAIALLADPQSTGYAWGGWGAVVAAGFGIMALLRSGGEAPRIPAAGRSPTLPSGATPSGDVATPHKRRMSDASLLAWTVVAIVITLVVGFFVVVWSICSDPTEWC
jgi:hypothetical protein